MRSESGRLSELNGECSDYLLSLSHMSHMYIMTVVLDVAVREIFSPVYLLMQREHRKN